MGKTEQELKAAAVKYNIGKFSFSANSRAKTNLDSEGFVKIITEKETDKILGAHIIGESDFPREMCLVVNSDVGGM